MTPGTARIAATAASAAGSAAAWSVAEDQEVAAGDALDVPNMSSQTNSPSITGTRQ